MRKCEHCGDALSAGACKHARFCGKKECKQARNRQKWREWYARNAKHQIARCKKTYSLLRQTEEGMARLRRYWKTSKENQKRKRLARA